MKNSLTHRVFLRESGFAFFCEIITSGAIFFFIFHVFCMAVFCFDIWKGNFIGVLFWQLLYKNQNCRNYLRFFEFIMWKLVARVIFFQKFWEIVGVSLIFSKANQTRRTRFGFFLDIDFGFAILFFWHKVFLSNPRDEKKIKLD